MVWTARRFGSRSDVDRLVEDFHATHREIFAIDDPESEIEMVTWRLRVRCRLRQGEIGAFANPTSRRSTPASRSAYFPRHGRIETRVVDLSGMAYGEDIAGPAIVESSYTTVVVDPGASARRAATGSLIVTP